MAKRRRRVRRARLTIAASSRNYCHAHVFTPVLLAEVALSDTRCDVSLHELTGAHRPVDVRGQASEEFRVFLARQRGSGHNYCL